MIPEYVRCGDRYVVPTHLIKYFYMDTKDNSLTVKLTDGEMIELSYGDTDKARLNCLRNYVYLLDTLGVEYPNWITTEDFKSINKELPVIAPEPKYRSTNRPPDWVTSIDGEW